jgi:outer membrane protein assembly factor BamB
MLHALDGQDGEVLWSFDAQLAIRGDPVVVPNAIVVTTAGSEVIVIAGD